MATSFPAVYLNKLKELFASITHPHSISDITNLQTTLNGKAASSHGTHVTTSTCVTSVNGSKGVVTITPSDIGCVGFPDYANMTDIKTDYNAVRSSTGYTVSANGWIYATPMGSSVIKINGGAVIGQSENLTNKQMVPVKNGDKLSGGGAASIFFIPMR